MPKPNAPHVHHQNVTEDVRNALLAVVVAFEREKKLRAGRAWLNGLLYAILKIEDGVPVAALKDEYLARRRKRDGRAA